MQVSAGESNGAASHLPSELNLCDLHTDELAYIGIFGSGKHCTNYIISLECAADLAHRRPVHASLLSFEGHF